jgi:transcriptional regulator with XRE-family HTH domain
MFFGDEHLGKAIAMLRESMDLNQKELAREIGVGPNTMNQYESGRRGMSVEVLSKVAVVLERDPIEIWDMAYSIFRFNHFRERAEREGINVDEVIDRAESRPSLGMILELYDATAARDRQLVSAILRFLEPADRAAGGGLGLARVVVRPHPHRTARTQKALRFSRKERPGSPEPR